MCVRDNVVLFQYDEEFKMKNKALQALEKEMLDRVQRLQEVIRQWYI